jgi:hypothetical protein
MAYLLINTDISGNITPVRVFLNKGEVDFVQGILAADPATPLSFMELPLGMAVTVID